jgi:hypothetical protein
MPSRYAPFLFGFVLSGLMSLIVSGVATVRNAGFGDDFLGMWINAWLSPGWWLSRLFSWSRRSHAVLSL